MYVYPTEDSTRRIVKRIGEGFGFGWSLAYANGYIWKLETGNLIRIDPITEANKTYTVNTTEILGPRGFCYDGEYFWVNDHSRKKVVKFKVNETDIEYYGSFAVPNPVVGMSSGLTADGTFLYMVSLGGKKLYELNKDGSVNNQTDITSFAAEGDFAWNGTHFFSTDGSNLLIWTKNGSIEGKIYEVADGGYAYTWDGTYLWGIYKTCEIWNDPKIFQIEIKDTSHIS